MDMATNYTVAHMLHPHDDSHAYQFCPRCGGPLERRMLKATEPERPVCARCGFVFYLDPKIAVGTIIQSQNGGLVLVRRGAIAQVMPVERMPVAGEIRAGVDVPSGTDVGTSRLNENIIIRQTRSNGAVHVSHPPEGK